MSQSETIVGLGARTDYLAQVPNADPVRLRLTAEEGRLFVQIGRFSRIDELISRCGIDEPRAIALLLSLRAKGAVVPARVNIPTGPAPRVDAAGNEEVDLTAERKQEVLDFERKAESGNHYEVLGLEHGATTEQVRLAYYALSKRYHPDRFYGKNLGSFKYRVDRIFKRVAEAYNVLSDPERRAEYLKANPHLVPRPVARAEPEAPRAAPEDPARLAERRARMARHPYLLKNNRMTELLSRARMHIDKGEPGMALTDLHVALQLDPQNKDLQQLQAEARRSHDVLRATQEFARAEECEKGGDLPAACGRYRTAASIDAGNAKAAYRAALLMRDLAQDPREIRVFAQRAVDLEPKNADARVLLAQILADSDMKKLARKQLEEALQVNPEHAEAKKLLKKMKWSF